MKNKNISRKNVVVLIMLIGGMNFSACQPASPTTAPTASQIFTLPKANFRFSAPAATIALSALDGVTVCYTTTAAKLFIFNGICRASAAYDGEIELSCPKDKVSSKTLVKVNLLFEWPGATPDEPPSLQKRSASYWLDCSDADGDGIPAPDDNCPSISNPGQIDTNNDGVGDSCDFVTHHCPAELL